MLCVLAWLTWAGCSRTDPQDLDTPAFEIVKSYEQGPLHVDLRVERPKISVADRLRVVLEATAAESQEVELPERSEKLGEFVVADYRSAQPRLIEEGRVLYRRSYILEPFLAGEYKIPPLAVRYGEKHADATARQEIRTEEVTVAVTSVLPQGEQKPELKEIAAPVEMPAPWWPWVAGGVAVAALLAALFWWRRRRRLQAGVIPPLAPHEVAYQELERLLAAGLLERGETKLFYLRLSNLLRYYIEDRFGLRAPEQTTEEFLADLQRNQPFGARQKESLRSFLQHCDLVKFAELQTTREDAEGAVVSCRRFIEETKQEAVAAPEAAVAT
jgi:hypothetical protein